MKRMLFLVIVIFEHLLSASCIGPGLNNWSYELPNGYAIWYMNSNSIKIGLLYADSTGLTLYNEHKELIGIPSKVVEFCFNSQYIFAKTIFPTDTKFSESENNIYHYYILDSLNRKLIGPFYNSKDFLEIVISLSLQEKMSDWFSTTYSPKRIKHGVLYLDQNMVVPGPFGEYIDEATGTKYYLDKGKE